MGPCEVVGADVACNKRGRQLAGSVLASKAGSTMMLSAPVQLIHSYEAYSRSQQVDHSVVERGVGSVVSWRVWLGVRPELDQSQMWV